MRGIQHLKAPCFRLPANSGGCSSCCSLSNISPQLSKLEIYSQKIENNCGICPVAKLYPGLLTGKSISQFKSRVFTYSSIIFIRTTFYNMTDFLGRQKHFLCSLMACLGLHAFTLYFSCILICMVREESCHLCTPRGV